MPLTREMLLDTLIPGQTAAIRPSSGEDPAAFAATLHLLDGLHAEGIIRILSKQRESVESDAQICLVVIRRSEVI